MLIVLECFSINVSGLKVLKPLQGHSGDSTLPKRGEVKNGLGFEFTFLTFRDGRVVKFWKHVVTVLTVIDMCVWTLKESKHSFAFINRHKLLKPLKAVIITR
jgi:hypothetical protein